MSVVIRLKRVGTLKRPFYRVVVSDSRRPRDGRYIEEIGSYEPTKNPPQIKVKAERAQYWLKVGARPSETVKSLFKKADIQRG